MLSRGRLSRCARMIMLVVLALSCTVSSAHAQPEAAKPPAEPAPPDAAKPDAAKPDAQPTEGEAKQACIDAFDRSQSLRLDGKLIEAREDLVRCGQAHCPELIRVKCVPWLEEVNRHIPSVVIDARNAEGGDLVDVRVYVDGELAREQLDGTAIQLDPGARELRLVYGDRSETRKLLVRQGEKNRVVRVTFAPAKPPEQPKPKPKISPKPNKDEADPDDEEDGVSKVAWVGFGVGGAALAVGVITGAVALVKGDELEDECGEAYLDGELRQGVCHGAQESDLRAAEVVAHISTISFAVAGAGAALGVIGLILSYNGDDADEEKDESIRWQPLLGPAFVGVKAQW